MATSRRAAALVSASVLAFGVVLPVSAGAAVAEAPTAAVEAGKPGVDNFVNILSTSGCSASVVRFRGAPDSDKAIAMTNGHCTDVGTNQQFQANKASSKTFDVLDANSGQKKATLRSTTMLYSSQYGSDIAFFELAETYGSLTQKYGYSGLIIAEQGPKVGDKLVVASGYWRKLYSCPVSALIHGIIPDASTKQWQREAVRYDHYGQMPSDSQVKADCRTKGGTSGSPVVDSNTGEVVVINNSGNDKAVSGCTKDDTCEVDPNGRRTSRGPAGYGVPTHWVYTCLDGSKFNLKKPGCKYAGGDSLPAAP